MAGTGNVKVNLAKASGLSTEDAARAARSLGRGEVIITDPETGGQKGRKPERFELLPAEALAETARVYAYGSSKYEDHNWRKGYAWSLSFGAMMRHLWAFWRGEDNDPESGLSHLGHAAFHVLTLLTYTLTSNGTDDRP